MAKKKENILMFPSGSRLEGNGLFSQFRREIEKDNLYSASVVLGKILDIDPEKAISAATHFKLSVSKDSNFWIRFRELQLKIDTGSTRELSDAITGLFGIEGPDLIITISNIRKWTE